MFVDFVGSRPARVLFRHTRLAALLASLAAFGGPARASVTPQFNDESSLAATHDADGDGPSPPQFSPMNLPAGRAQLMSPFSPNTINFTGGSTRAKAGAGRTEGTNLARLTFPTGMGIDQVDPNHVQPRSTLVVNFRFIWDIGGGTLGPPINGNFSIPVGAKVGAGGSATVRTDVHWDVVQYGDVDTDRRAPFVTTRNFGQGTTLTTITAPAAPFSPSSITDTEGVEQIIIRGSITFEADNDTTPTTIEVLGPLDQSIYTPTSFYDELIANPQYQQDYGGASFEEISVPEPTAAGLLAIGSAVLLTRRRARR